MNKIKKIPIFIVVISILLVPCAFSVSASTYTFQFNIEEPMSNEYSGYLIQPMISSNGSVKTAFLYFWQLTPVNVPDNDSVPYSSYYYDSATGTASLSFGTGQTGVSYLLSLWYTADGNSNVRLINSQVISYSSAYTFTIKLGSYSSFLTPKFKGLSSADSLPTGRVETYDVLWSADSVIYNELLYQYEQLVNLVSTLELTNEQLEETYSLLADYLNKIMLYNRSIDFYITSLYEDIYWWSMQVDADNARIIELLEQLIEGTEEFTESSTLSDEQNELNRVEDELLNNEDASNAQNEIKVEVNENAMSFIWDFITRFLNAHPKLMGLVVSILSLGIIALILNR